jgi:hypothetical protein
MRSGYTEELEQRDLAMWRGRVASSIRGKRGQKLLKNLLAALDEMPQKRLIPNELVDGDDVCLLGAGGRRLGIADIDTIDPSDHDALAKRFDVAECLIQEIEFINDDDFSCRSKTPEERYEEVRKWLVKNIHSADSAAV